MAVVPRNKPLTCSSTHLYLVKTLGALLTTVPFIQENPFRTAAKQIVCAEPEAMSGLKAKGKGLI